VMGIEALIPAPHTLLTLGRRAVLVVVAVGIVYVLWRYGWPRQQPTRRGELWAQRGLVVALTAVVAVEAVSVGVTGRTAIAAWDASLLNVALDPFRALVEGIR